MQAILNGTITNDKFCMSRVRQMQLMPARPARKSEVKYPSEGNEMDCFPQEDTHETTAMDRWAFHDPDNRRPTPMGSSLPIAGPREFNSTRRKIQKPQSAGGKR